MEIAGRAVPRIFADEDLPLIDAGMVPQIYSNGPACAEIVGQDVVITYYQRRVVHGAAVKVPVLEMIRPLSSCQCCEALRDMIERARARQQDEAGAAAHH